MKKTSSHLLVLTVLFSLCASFSFAQAGKKPASGSDVLLVMEGRGLKGIYFDTATMEDVQKIMGTGMVVKPGEKGTSSTSGITRLDYKGGYLKNGHGLEFEFKENKLYEICMGDSVKAKTNKGIILNKSTKDDVTAKYGTPTIPGLFNYPELGISFATKADGTVYRMVLHKAVAMH
jgi:hypothetical protein